MIQLQAKLIWKAVCVCVCNYEKDTETFIVYFDVTVDICSGFFKYFFIQKYV